MDDLRTVSVTLPDLGGATDEEAAEVFWAVLDDYRQGGLGTIFVDVRLARTDRVSRIIELDPTTGKVVKS